VDKRLVRVNENIVVGREVWWIVGEDEVVPQAVTFVDRQQHGDHI
jgi:hypothetical protein